MRGRVVRKQGTFYNRPSEILHFEYMLCATPIDDVIEFIIPCNVDAEVLTLLRSGVLPCVNEQADVTNWYNWCLIDV